MTDKNRAFRDWIRTLEEEVIQGEYGYEPGEFSVVPEHWRPMFRKGLTPLEAFRRALAASEEARRERDERQRQNWERIKAADASFIAAQRSTTPSAE